jgi:hypothetical protein
MAIKEPRSPLDKAPERAIKERKPSQYAGDLPGIDQGYTRHSAADTKPNTPSKKKTA